MDPQLLFSVLPIRKATTFPCAPSLLCVPWTAIRLRLKALRDRKLAISHPLSESTLSTRVFLQLFICWHLQGVKSGLSWEFWSLAELLWAYFPYMVQRSVGGVDRYSFGGSSFGFFPSRIPLLSSALTSGVLQVRKIKSFSMWVPHPCTVNHKPHGWCFAPA